ncbi:hypothetical protein DL988_22265 [Shigella flexneri]|nr:hypothetical protein [Shigella flexneri]
MSSDINENKILLTAGDVSVMLDIKESTLRKYALLLQDAGYHFYTNSKGQRAYYERDVAIFRRFIEIKKSPDMTLEQSANAVMTWVNQSGVSVIDTQKNVEIDRYNTDIKELKETVQQQNIMLQELMKKMDEQQKYINLRLDQRDKKLMESIRQSQEERQALLQLATTLEDERKKGFFSRLFGSGKK